MKFTSTLFDDLSQIAEWSTADIDVTHRDIPAEWWLTGSDCVLAFCVEDDSGPTMYVRMDDEKPWARLNTQFAPENQVSKKRVVDSLLWGFPVLTESMKKFGFKGVVFESKFPDLVLFMGKLGFKHKEKDDYLLKFSEVQ